MTSGCGTFAGYHTHRRHGSAPCEPCLEAKRVYEAERNAERRAELSAMVPPSEAMPGALPPSFWERVDLRWSLDECWEWIAAKQSQGYGYFAGPRLWPTTLAHRLSYLAMVGPIPDGLQLDHLCRNRACVNPAHLEPVTPGENTRRGVAVRTECPAGHPYGPENTYYRKDRPGRRQCGVCQRERSRIRRAKARAVREAAA